MTVRTRFAPSPTGYLHIGGARTALFSWLYARRFGGRFILRIEDTDLERSTEESVEAIFQGMTWLGLDYDEGPFFQTKRMERYREVIRQLLDSGHAYHCYCSKEELETMRNEQMARKEKPRYDGRCRDRHDTPEGVQPVIRFRNPQEGAVVIEDLVKGRVVVQNNELDDLIIARSDGTPTYNLTVVVDDLDMGITHVIRGDDHLNNTPRQINILKSLGAELPQYAHVSMILGEDGKRLSKRHGAVSVMQYQENGFLPEALLNYLVRLGWSHGDQEIFSRDEMVEFFDLDAVNKAAATFDPQKMLWLNEQYLKNTDEERLVDALQPYLDFEPATSPPLASVINALRGRVKTLVEMADAARVFYQDPEHIDPQAAEKHLGQTALPVLKTAREMFAVEQDWSVEHLKQVIKELAQDMGLKMGQVGMPLRVALTGNTDSPDIGLTLYLMGRDAVLRRLDKAMKSVTESA
jgi:glutamyl-tRNA synthetase